MITLGPPIVALLIATFLAWLELITSKYPRTFSLMLGSAALYVYALIYGALAFAVTLGIAALSNAGIIKLQGLGLASVLVQAIAVGISFKALLHIRLFSFTAGSESVPIGIETLVQIFEPWLLRAVELDEFNAMAAYIEPRAKKYPNLSEVKKNIQDNIPKGSALESRAFLVDVQSANTVKKAMSLYLTF